VSLLSQDYLFPSTYTPLTSFIFYLVHLLAYPPSNLVTETTANLFLPSSLVTSMEEAIIEAVNTTATTFASAIAGAIELAFDEAVDKAVEERVHAIEDHYTAALDKAVEEKAKAIEEAMKQKLHRASRMAELRANIKAAEDLKAELDEIAEKFGVGYPALSTWISEKRLKLLLNSFQWKAVLNELEAQDKEQV